LSVGILIAAVLAVVAVMPVVLLIRLFWGAWPNQTAWLWIGGVLASQILTTAVGYALRPPKTPPSNLNAER